MTHENPHTITLALSEEENALLDALAQEQGLATSADALRTLIHDAIAVYDALWDKTFSESQDLLDQLADEADAEYSAGQTEDFDPDSDFDTQ
jgi:hypothetical protein